MQGKDRTGLVAALVLHVMGESFDTIRADYVASEEGLADSRADDIKELESAFDFSCGDDYHHAQFDNIDTALKFLCDKYGSVDEYLDTIGFDETWRQKLRTSLGRGDN